MAGAPHSTPSRLRARARAQSPHPGRPRPGAAGVSLLSRLSAPLCSYISREPENGERTAYALRTALPYLPPLMHVNVSFYVDVVFICVRVLDLAGTLDRAAEIRGLRRETVRVERSSRRSRSRDIDHGDLRIMR